MSLKQKISIDIAGRPYSFKVDSEEVEERIRKAGKLISEKLFLHKQRFGDKDIQDLLAFAALQFAIKTIELEIKTDTTEQVDRLSQICGQLDAFLSQNTDC